MADVDFGAQGRRRRYQVPALESPALSEPPKFPGVEPPQTDLPGPVTRPTLSENPFPPNVPVGNAGFSTVAPEPPRAPQRWSTHLDNMPSWLQGLNESAQNQVREIYNTQADPGGHLQTLANQRRQQVRGMGGRAADDDATILRQIFGGEPAVFDDPSTRQLEDMLRRQMEILQQPNPQLEQLVNFLNQQFQQQSQAPGYSPEELAVLRTQAFEPVEAYRQASGRRALERASARGMLPSSGLHELDMRDIDMASDRARTALDRDLAINQIGERNRDLANAAQLAMQAYQVPQAHQQQQFADLLQRSSLLYDLPSRAMQEALSVIQGTPGPQSLFSQLASQAGIQLQQQQMNQQRNAQVWDAIGRLLAGMGG